MEEWGLKVFTRTSILSATPMRYDLHIRNGISFMVLANSIFCKLYHSGNIELVLIWPEQ